MSHSSGNGPDFHLPDEILSVIPTDPYDQLDLARKITSMAIASRVSKLEAETNRLKQNVHEKDRLICELEEKASNLNKAFQEADSRLKAVSDENVKLTQERDSLSATVKKLNRELSKLETFKRQLMQSLSEETSSPETVDIGTCDQPAPKAYPDAGGEQWSPGTPQSTREISIYIFIFLISYKIIIKSTKLDVTIKIYAQIIGTCSMVFPYFLADYQGKTDRKFSATPYHITPRLTPSGTPKAVSGSQSPRAYSSAATPHRTSGATTPIKSQYDGRGSLSSWFPSSQQSSAANSPPRGRQLPARTPRIDGKEFFRQARSRLSYEQFSAFLANIKDLNAQKQSREETLNKAKEIFGADNEDLYLSFQGLLSRNVN